MIDTAKGAWTWFVTGLAEALLWLLERFSGAATYRIIIGDRSAAIEAPDGKTIGRLVDADGSMQFEPAGLVKRLASSRIDLLVPPSWLFRRELDPVALQSVPFLDAFVRHQIERITPWRAGDVHYAVRQDVLPSDPTRVAVGVDIVPRRLVGGWIAGLDVLRPRRLRLISQADPHKVGTGILLGTGASLLAASMRDRIALGLVVTGLCFFGAFGWLWWQAAAVQDDIAEQDRVLDERKAVLARVHRQDQGGTDIDAQLRTIRRARPRAVDVIDALAKALPDGTHLTELSLQKSQMTIAGVSADTSLLVPALERSGRFADVAFGASTTKVELGAGDRFQLDMRVRDPAPAAP